MTHLVFELSVLLISAVGLGYLTGVTSKTLYLSYIAPLGRVSGEYPDSVAAKNQLPFSQSRCEEAPSTGEGMQPEAVSWPRNGERDPLQKIKGITSKVESVLNGLGVFHFDQIASWSEENIVWLDAHFGFHGRITREKWVDQARKLSNTKGSKY